MHASKRQPSIPEWARRAGGIAIVALLALAGDAARHAVATPEGSITYTVAQSPAAGAILQVGGTLSFTIDVTSAPGAFTGPVVFDLKKPTGTSFAGYGVQVGNIITACADNTPAGGYIRCTAGNGNSIPAGALESGTAQEIAVNFTVDAASAGVTYSDGAVQALFSDGGSGFRNAGDLPDTIGSGDDLLASVGGFTVTNILGSGANISVSTSATPMALFEGAVTTVAVTFNHGLAPFGQLVQPLEVAVTNGDVQAASVSCPGGSGGVFGTAARCTASTVSDGSTMTFQVRARDTGAGDDIGLTVSAPSLGLTTAEASASSSGVARLSVAVDEVGIQTTVPSAPPWLVGTPISVCTGGAAETANDSAGGAAQDPSLVAGTSTLSPVTPLAAADYQVSGPLGSVSFTYLGPGQCGADQSGVQFTPSASGAYSISAYSNGDTTSIGTQQATRGSNVLALSVQATNPVPAIGSLSPTSVTAGSTGFTLTVSGSNFVATSTVRWNGGDRPTAFISPSQLGATISASDVAVAGSASVTVANPAPGGGVSNSSTFTVDTTPNPAPLIGSLTPSTANAGSAGFTVTVNGSSFVPGAVVRWNGADRATTFLSTTQLTANILTGDLAAAGTGNVSVFNPAPGGGTSPTVPFTITNAPNPPPVLTSIAPTGAFAGASAFTLTVNGSGFVAGSVVRWNGADRPTTFLSGAQLSAAISASDIAATGTATVTVFTGPPGGGTSTSVAFAITNPLPVLASVAPATVPAGGAAFNLAVSGSGFAAASVVRWNGADRVTTFVSATQLTAAVSAADIAAPATVPITVSSPGPGGGVSAAIDVAVQNPVPAVASLSPATMPAGNAAFTLTLNGTGFVSGAIVRWDGADRATTFVSATQLTATIPAADLLTTKTVTVTVFSPSPGGGVSSGVSFSVGTPVLQDTDRLVIEAPGAAVISRSRLAFSATSGDLAPASVSLIVKRSSDNKYWNGATHAWQTDAFENATTHADSGEFVLAVTGEDRRQFANTTVVVEARAVAAGLPYRGSATRTFVIR